MRLIDADALINRMYHDAFETDTDMQRWDSGCWIRYKMFEKAIDEQPIIEPNLILPERMERGDCYEVGETIVVMNHDDYYDLLCKAMENEPKQGEWIGEGDGYADGGIVYDTWYCSNCDHCEEGEELALPNFCPNCGSRMRGADDETE